MGGRNPAGMLLISRATTSRRNDKLRFIVANRSLADGPRVGVGSNVGARDPGTSTVGAAVETGVGFGMPETDTVDVGVGTETVGDGAGLPDVYDD